MAVLEAAALAYGFESLLLHQPSGQHLHSKFPLLDAPCAILSIL